MSLYGRLVSTVQRLFRDSTHRPGAAEREQTCNDPRLGAKTRCRHCGTLVYRRQMQGGQCAECFVRAMFRKGPK